jgi:hypothetical protein
LYAAIVPGEGNFYAMSVVGFAEDSKILTFVTSPNTEWLHVINF